ncbi:hypothetical protein K402DRAFT_456085 [Aulographum hederae CBS 113979]|uniref:Uncharacterized protein n=1 Tax=Aulographum hederae CBS 113979 TaxID=1176131 RepID=A0A6G1GSZ1_9PEZI|nr:hypothetical protein K402DRAFT_456085 [Aulographum hederae CBS 113979]
MGGSTRKKQKSPTVTLSDVQREEAANNPTNGSSQPPKTPIKPKSGVKQKSDLANKEDDAAWIQLFDSSSPIHKADVIATAKDHNAQIEKARDCVLRGKSLFEEFTLLLKTISSKCLKTFIKEYQSQAARPRSMQQVRPPLNFNTIIQTLVPGVGVDQLAVVSQMLEMERVYFFGTLSEDLLAKVRQTLCSLDEMAAQRRGDVYTLDSTTQDPTPFKFEDELATVFSQRPSSNSPPNETSEDESDTGNGNSSEHINNEELEKYIARMEKEVESHYTMLASLQSCAEAVIRQKAAIESKFGSEVDTLEAMDANTADALVTEKLDQAFDVEDRENREETIFAGKMHAIRGFIYKWTSKAIIKKMEEVECFYNDLKLIVPP